MHNSISRSHDNYETVVKQPTSQQIFDQHAQSFEKVFGERQSPDGQLDIQLVIQGIYRDLEVLAQILPTPIGHHEIRDHEIDHYRRVWRELPSGQLAVRDVDPTIWQYCLDHLECYFAELSDRSWQRLATNAVDYQNICLFVHWIRIQANNNRCWLVLYDFIIVNICLNKNNKQHQQFAPIFLQWFKLLVQEFGELFARTDFDLQTNSVELRLHDIVYAGLVKQFVAYSSLCSVPLSLFTQTPTADQISWRLWRRSSSDRLHQLRRLASGFAGFKPYGSYWSYLLQTHDCLEKTLPTSKLLVGLREIQHRTDNTADFNAGDLFELTTDMDNIHNPYAQPPARRKAQLRSKINAKQIQRNLRRAYVRGLQALIDHTGISDAHKKKVIDIHGHYYTWRFVKRPNFLSERKPHNGWFKILLIKNHNILNADSCVHIPHCTQWDNLLSFVLDLANPLTELELLYRTNWRLNQTQRQINIRRPIQRNNQHINHRKQNTKQPCQKMDPAVVYFNRLLENYRQYIDKPASKSKIIRLDDIFLEGIYEDDSIPPWRHGAPRKKPMSVRKIKNQLNQNNPVAREYILRRYTHKAKMTKLWLQHIFGESFHLFADLNKKIHPDAKILAINDLAG